MIVILLYSLFLACRSHYSFSELHFLPHSCSRSSRFNVKALTHLIYRRQLGAKLVQQPCLLIKLQQFCTKPSICEVVAQHCFQIQVHLVVINPFKTLTLPVLHLITVFSLSILYANLSIKTFVAKMPNYIYQNIIILIKIV